LPLLDPLQRFVVSNRNPPIMTLSSPLAGESRD
jgi:hypothetical protein